MARSDDCLFRLYGIKSPALSSSWIPWSRVPDTGGGYRKPSLSAAIRGKRGFCGGLYSPGPPDMAIPGITYRGKKAYPAIGRSPGCCYRWLSRLGRPGRCPAEEGNSTRRPGRVRRSLVEKSAGRQGPSVGTGVEYGIRKAETCRKHPIDALPTPHPPTAYGVCLLRVARLSILSRPCPPRRPEQGPALQSTKKVRVGTV
jgi:hypothetical protein